jgi:hypothetical protein
MKYFKNINEFINYITQMLKFSELKKVVIEL